VDIKKIREIFLNNKCEPFPPFPPFRLCELYEKKTPEEIRFEIEFPITRIDEKKEEDKYNRSPIDRVICPFCSGSYQKTSGYLHRKSKRHKLYVYLNKQLIDLFKKY
jgi:hypothetical protein